MYDGAKDEEVLEIVGMGPAIAVVELLHGQ
jgi:hypothetical protein